MEPLDAIRRVHAAHPDATDADLASLVTQHGVPVTPTLVNIARRPRAAQPPLHPMLTTASHSSAHPLDAAEPRGAQDDFETAAASAIAVAQPSPSAQPPGRDAHPNALILDLAPMGAPHPEVCAPAASAQPSTPRRTVAEQSSDTRRMVHLPLPDERLMRDARS
ncbi:hypothetical protein ACFQ3Z_16175 [Streptomyces nogalater]